jgi:hypothetical protein
MEDMVCREKKDQDMEPMKAVSMARPITMETNKMIIMIPPNCIPHTHLTNIMLLKFY